MENIIKEMQILGTQISQKERELKKKKMEKTKLENKIRQLKKVKNDLQERKKMIFRERNKLTTENRRIKWQLEELKREESRTIPEISKTENEIQGLNKTFIWQEEDFFNFQTETRKKKRRYRQLLKKRQEIAKREGKM